MTAQVPVPQIRWAAVESLGPLGHGIVFGHQDYPRIPLAFAVGYEWLHRPGTAVSIQLLEIRPAEIAEGRWADTVAQVQQGVEQYFTSTNRSLDERRIGPAWFWLNA